MEDIHSIIHRKKERLKKLNDFDYITTMNVVKRNNEIYRLKGYIEALNDVKNKKIYTQEMDILERIYKNADENIKQENKQLKDKLSKIETLIINHNCDTGDIYYKYNSKFLKSELKQRILEIVYEVSE